MSNLCAGGVKLPRSGPCPKCGATESQTCGRWVQRAENDIELLALIRNAATQYGRCCDLYQDGLGGFHCHEDGQRTFQMLKDVQALLGFDKGLGKTTEEERAESVRRAHLNHAAPDLLAALRVIADWDQTRDKLAGEHPASLLDVIDAITSCARVAIAKAEGRS